jgi:spermidine synthase
MPRFFALFLTAVTGFTGLVYEVTWQKYLATLLGADSEATAAVLAIFLGGLSYGYALFGRLSRRVVERVRSDPSARGLLSIYGRIEAAIGVYALVFPLLFAVAQAVSLQLPQGYEGVIFAGDIALCALLIGPPAVLMGATIPFLTQALTRDLHDATRFHALVYATNTAGAFVGALAGAFVLIPSLGLNATLGAMGLLNITVGLIFMRLDRNHTHAAATAESQTAATLPKGFALYATVALIGGFSAMALQTIANRIGAVSLGGSEFTFAMVVATFVASIALGSVIVALLPTIRGGYLVTSQWIYVAYLLLLLPVVEDAGYWAYVTRAAFPGDAEAFHPYHAAVFLRLFAVMLVPLAMSGALLPLLFHHIRGQVGDLGQAAGRLYSYNTLGSLVGALVAGYAALFWLELHHVYRTLVIASALAALMLTARTLPGLRIAAVAAVIAVVAITTTAAPWSPERLSAGLYLRRSETELTGAGADAYFASAAVGTRDARVLFYDDDPTTSVAVVEMDHAEAGTSLSIKVNGKSDGNVPGDNITMGMLALLPALVVDAPRRSFVVGYGTGVTVGELASLDTMQEVVVAEISSAVLEAAPLFREHNLNADRLDNVRLVRSDAYRALLRSTGQFDVIVSEPSNPWISGVEMLLSTEFLEAARDRLSPRGVYVQWFHIYSMDEATISLVFETYRRTFDRVAVWYSLGTDLILLGLAEDAVMPSVETFEERFASDWFRARFARIGIGSFAELAAHELLPMGVVNASRFGSDVHTLTRPRLGYRAARAFFVGRDSPPPPTIARGAANAGATASLLARHLERQQGIAATTARLAALDETCTYVDDLCLTLFAQWLHEEPSSQDLAAALVQIGRAHDVPLNTHYLSSLALLFDPVLAGQLDPIYEIANGVLRMFSKHYHHAAPFDARALHIPWERCSDDLRCASELDRVKGLGVAR